VPVVAARFLAQRLPKLLATHPGLKVELVVSDQVGDMIEDRLDLAVRVGDITDASLIRRKGWNGERIVVAAPGYVERHGRPATPAELINHTCIIHNVELHSDVWTFVTPSGPLDVRVRGGLIANEAVVVRMAARTGYGIAFLPLPEVFDDLQSGELVRVLDDFQAPAVPINLVYPSRRHLAPRTRVVLDFIEKQIKEVRISVGMDTGRGR
jgi:DNA-binding transcriptional LysR family regulator